MAAAARTLVLVEGLSDRAAVEALAVRRGVDLAAAGVSVLVIGGAHAIGRVLQRHGPHAGGERLGGLVDAGEERHFQRALERAGLGHGLDREGLERLGFYVCVRDLEDELIRALGEDAVVELVEQHGEIRPFRTFQKQPAQRAVPLADQLHRFMGTHSGRKIAYGRFLVDALDLARVPCPLDRVLAYAVSPGSTP